MGVRPSLRAMQAPPVLTHWTTLTYDHCVGGSASEHEPNLHKER